MATITRDNVAPLTDKIVVQLEKNDYYPSFEKALKTYTKQVKMQGFRPGQVPIGLVKKMYGASIFSDEILKTVEKEINSYLKEQNPEIFAQPLPTEDNFQAMKDLDMNNPKELQFAFEIGLKPEFTIADLGTAHIKRHKVAVTEEMVNEEILKLQQRFGDLTEADVVDSDDKDVTLQFQEIDENGNDIAEAAPQEISLVVNYFSESVRPTLIGLKREDTLNITLSEAFAEKELKFVLNELGAVAEDSDKRFRLTISNITFVTHAPLNEEFFKKAYPTLELSSEEDFKSTLRQDIEGYWFNQDRGQVDDQIYHFLIDSTQVEFPEGFLKRWQLQAGEKDKPKTAEQIDHEWPGFVQSLKWTLISERLIREYQVEVHPDEIKAFARNQMMGYMGGQGDPGAMPWLDSYIENMTKDQKFVENTYNQIATDKLFAVAETKVQYDIEELTPEDFKKQQDHHAEHHHH